MSGLASRRKGSQFERDVVAVLRGWFPHAERAYGAGRPDDVGDIDGIPGVCFELKNHNRLEFGPWMTEAERERVTARADLAIVVAKRRGKGAAESFAVVSLADMAQLLKDAGR